MKILTSREMAAMDRQATEQYGIPSLTLMENAGRSVAEAAAKVAGGLEGRRVALFCGKGNNGGDGLVAARYLLRTGARPKVYLLGSFQDISPDARANLDMATRAGVDVRAVPDGSTLDELRRDVHASSLLIDAVLGTGFSPPVRGFYGEVLSFIAGLGIPLLSVDIPSGLSADSGQVEEPSLSANWTVTFGLPKVGQFLYPAAEKYGTLFLADIGFPESLEQKVESSRRLVTAASLSPSLPRCPPDSHKGRFGHILILAGSWGLVGASVLAARGALRTGAGLVTVALPESQAPPVLEGLPEAMILPLPETARGTPGERALDVLLENMTGKAVMAVGPGLSRNPETARLVRSLIPQVRVPLVIDADGLNAFAGNTSVLLESKADIVITPHPGELGRLLGLTATDIQERRIGFAQDFSKKYGVIVALKGAMTVVATPSGQVHVNPTGNPGMAAGGMGDVLTGAVAAFIGQGCGILQSTLLGVYIHGLAGDLAAARTGSRGYLAGEVADELPRAIADLVVRGRDEQSPDETLRLLIAR